MNFNDYENKQDLIGKTVLYESGMSYSDNRRRCLLKIEKVTKTGFKLFTMPNSIFSFISGNQNGLNGKMNMGIISQCTLVTDEDANELRRLWKRHKEEKLLRETILEKIKTMTFEQLKKIELL